jgi:hypothetical protein
MIFTHTHTNSLTGCRPTGNLPDADPSLDGRPVVGAPSGADTWTAEELVVGPRKSSDNDPGAGYWVRCESTQTAVSLSKLKYRLRLRWVRSGMFSASIQ